MQNVGFYVILYLNFTVKTPNAAGKLLYEKRGNTTYVKYEYDRVYVPEKSTRIQKEQQSERCLYRMKL